MRKLFGQKSKSKPHQTLTPVTAVTSTLIGAQALQRDDETQTNNSSKSKPNATTTTTTTALLETANAPSDISVPVEASNKILINESLSSDVSSSQTSTSTTNLLEEAKDKSKKLVVVVSGLFLFDRFFATRESRKIA